MGAETDLPPPVPTRSPEPEVLDHEHRSWKADMMSALGESVSFGRFLSEPLEWGKWSAFAHNRYLEEAAGQSRPGSVAQKKAFFEAHYAKKRTSEVDDDDEDAGRDLGLGATDGAAASSADSSCMTDEPAGEEEARGVDSDAAVDGRRGVVTAGPVEASEELEAIAEGIGSSCRVGGADEWCHGEDGVQVGEAGDGWQVQEKQEDTSQDFCDANYVAVDEVERQPLKESSIVNQGVTDSAKKRRLPMSSLLEKPTKFSSPPSGKKGISSSAKKRSPLHSAKENSSPPCTDSSKQAAISIPQKRSALAALHMSMNFTRCETGNAPSSSRNLGSTIAARISQLESVSRPAKGTQPEVNQFRPPRKAFFKGVPEIAFRTSQLEEQRSSRVTRVKEKLFGSTSPSVHQKTNITKEKVGKANNERELKELRQSFCFYRKNKQAKDSSQQSAQEITNLPSCDHLLNDVSYAHPVSKGASKDKQMCCFPLRRLC